MIADRTATCHWPEKKEDFLTQMNTDVGAENHDGWQRPSSRREFSRSVFILSYLW
jgi:hypothetical protein